MKQSPFFQSRAVNRPISSNQFEQISGANSKGKFETNREALNQDSEVFVGSKQGQQTQFVFKREGRDTIRISPEMVGKLPERIIYIYIYI